MNFLQTWGIREVLSTGYGLRLSTEIYGSKRDKIVFQEYLQEYCFVPTEISEHFKEFSGECNLGILYSGSLSWTVPEFLDQELFIAGSCSVD